MHRKAQGGTGMHCGQTGGHNLCVCVCVRSQFNTQHCSRSCSSRDGEGYGEGRGQRVPNVGGQRFSFNCAIAACFTSTAAHCAHCACPQNDTSHDFSILFCASCDPREPPRACLHVFPSYPPPPLNHPLIQLCKMLLISLRWQSRREGEGGRVFTKFPSFVCDL